MKIKANIKLREMAGESVIVLQGSVGADLTRIIALNSSARYLFETLSGREFTLEDAAQALVEHFGIPEAQALTDALKWVEDLTIQGIIE